MGCDGGTIPKRDELVKTKKKKEQKDRSSELAFRTQHCAITQQPLVQPIVACQLGRLYNKESILEKLLDKSAPEHINKMSDVTTLSLTPNPAVELNSTVAEKGDGYIDVMKSKYICPITGLEMNGRFRFLFLITCGCVMADRAMTMTGATVGDEQLDCPSCLKKFMKSTDIIILNPSDEEIEKMKENLTRRQQIARDLKKGKKRSAAAAATATAISAEAVDSTATITGKLTVLPNATALASSSTSVQSRHSIGHGSTPKQGSSSSSANPSKTPSTTAAPASKKLKSDYSVAADPNVSDTYKSLFTSSDKAKEQGKAHWVTYNPFYN